MSRSALKWQPMLRVIFSLIFSSVLLSAEAEEVEVLVEKPSVIVIYLEKPSLLVTFTADAGHGREDGKIQYHGTMEYLFCQPQEQPPKSVSILFDLEDRQAIPPKVLRGVLDNPIPYTAQSRGSRSVHGRIRSYTNPLRFWLLVEGKHIKESDGTKKLFALHFPVSHLFITSQPSGADVSVWEKGAPEEKRESTTSESPVRFELTAEQPYTVKIQKAGYKARSEEITLRGGESVFKNDRLTPIPIAGMVQYKDTLKPVGDAFVSIVELGYRTVTDAKGRFEFRDWERHPPEKDKAYTLRVTDPQRRFRSTSGSFRFSDKPGEQNFTVQRIPPTLPTYKDLVKLGGVQVGKEQVEIFIRSLPLFGLGAEHQSDFDSGTISAKLREAFENRGLLLPDNATISTTISGQAWEITIDQQVVYLIRKEADRLNVYRNLQSVLTSPFARPD